MKKYLSGYTIGYLTDHDVYDTFELKILQHDLKILLNKAKNNRLNKDEKNFLQDNNYIV